MKQTPFCANRRASRLTACGGPKGRGRGEKAEEGGDTGRRWGSMQFCASLCKEKKHCVVLYPNQGEEIRFTWTGGNVCDYVCLPEEAFWGSYMWSTLTTLVLTSGMKCFRKLMLV